MLHLYACYEKTVILLSKQEYGFNSLMNNGWVLYGLSKNKIHFEPIYLVSSSYFNFCENII